MTILEEELKVLHHVEKEMYKADNRDSIIKIYRQARTWTRMHCVYGEACSREMSRFLNNKFKQYRWDALAAIDA